MEVYGSKGRSVLEGSGDNDSFSLYAGKGTQRVEGGAGTDTVVLSGATSSYWLEQSQGGVLLHMGEQSVQLLGIEQLRIGDQTYSVQHALAPQLGTAGDDQVRLFANQSQFDGGAGVDSVYLPMAYGAGLELKREGATWVVKSDSKSLRLDNVEVLEFSNLRLDLRSQGEQALQAMQRIEQGKDVKLTGNDLSLDLNGGGGNDELEGRGGDDSLYGGKGNDVAVFRGARSEYEVRLDVSTGRASVRDLVSGRDGIDELSSVEQLRFADGTVAVDAVAERYASVTPPPVQTFVVIGSHVAEWVDAPGLAIGASEDTRPDATWVLWATSGETGMSFGETIADVEADLPRGMHSSLDDRFDAPSPAVELLGVSDTFTAGWSIHHLMLQP